MKTTNTTITAATITSTTNTNNTTKSIKEGKTMKNTRNIRTKVIAGILAAITAASAMTAAAGAENVQMYPGPTGIEIEIPAVHEEDAISPEAPSGKLETTPTISADELPAGEIPATGFNSDGLPTEVSADEGENPKAPEAPSGKLETTPTISADELPAGEIPADGTNHTVTGAALKAEEDTTVVISSFPMDFTLPFKDGYYRTDSSDVSSENYIPSNDIFNHPINGSGDLSEEEKAVLKKIIKGLVKGGIDTLAVNAPGGRIFGEPLKTLVEDAMGGNSTTNAIKRLSEVQTKYYEDLKLRIDNLNDDLSKYTKYIEKTIVSQGDKNSLGQMFRDMSSSLVDLTSTVKGIMTNDKTTPEEKLVLLANANYGKGNTNYLVKVREELVKLSTTIGNANPTALDLNLYSTLMDLASKNYMFAGEAHADAMESAPALTEQYLYANAVILQCQNAFKALAELTPEQVEALKAKPEIYAMYEKCMAYEEQSFQTDKQDETLSRLVRCLAGYDVFSNKESEGNRYIKNGTNSDQIILDFKVRTVDVPNSEDFRKAFQNQYFKEKEMGEFLAYVRKTGMSVKDFLEKNNQNLTLPANDSQNNKHCYLVIDPKLTGSRTRKEYDFFKGSVYGYTQTIKVVDIYDPEC
ncbi:MAG: hypothetical protein J6U10_03505, partial [Lachnospiraceae bacterium]|nr:hypothetical protein [Lachnospiraceae bacterium]